MKYYLIKWQYNVMNLIGEKFIFNNNPPHIFKFITNIQYVEDQDSIRLLDIAVPDGNGMFPIIIYVHGGGWMSGNKNSYTRICKSFAKDGYLTFNINYRLAPKYSYPIQIQDIASAINWVEKNAEIYGGDKTKIFLAGDSSGAHLISHYVTILENEDLKKITNIEKVISIDVIKGILLFYGVYNISDLDKLNSPIIKIQNESFLGKDLDLYKKRVKLTSSIFYINKKFPPAFICTGEVDIIHPQSVELAKELSKYKVNYKLLMLSKQEYPEAKHAFLNFYKRKCSRVAMDEAVKFLNSI
ncbi:alpha/beta hydrolase [Clostridium estertheticum]|uniref:alpha/beta hydrolase n=1 Tax=Clostridium estertheticum TaxID=238834 RepID=UPI0013EE5266|nr:alpha/beta hydrolase [Clostridium estertheticum]MBZ9607890.1 alpha/beta hydrolase [Clostridium estertheticum]